MTLNVVLAFTSKSVPRIKTRSVTFPIVENSRPTDGSFENNIYMKKIKMSEL